MKRVIIESIGDLKTINIHGVDPIKLTKVEQRVTHKDIPIKIDCRDGKMIILDGHHTSLVSFRNNLAISGIVYEDETEISDPTQRLNFQRAERLNDTASIMGVGTIREMLERYVLGKSKTR